MASLATVSKSTLLGLAITIITIGIDLVKSNLSDGSVEFMYCGVAMVVVGVALIGIFAFYLEKQVIDRLYKKLNKRLEELERKGKN